MAVFPSLTNITPVTSCAGYFLQRHGMQEIKIIIIESRFIIREGLKQILEASQGIAIVGEAMHCHEMLPLLSKTECHLIILGNSDRWLEELSALRLIRKAYGPTPVILIYSGSETMLDSHPLSKYADACLPMNIDKSKLAHVVWRVARQPLMSAKQSKGATLYAETPRHHRLSARELEVLCIMARGKTNQQIASVLTLSSKTVSTYRQRVLAKLECQNNAQLIQYAIQNGLVD